MPEKSSVAGKSRGSSIAMPDDTAGYQVASYLWWAWHVATKNVLALCFQDLHVIHRLFHRCFRFKTLKKNVYNSREKVINLPVKIMYHPNILFQPLEPCQRALGQFRQLILHHALLRISPNLSVELGHVGEHCCRKRGGIYWKSGSPKPWISIRKGSQNGWFGNITILGNHHICNAKSYAPNFLHTHFTFLMGPKSVPKQCKVHIYI